MDATALLTPPQLLLEMLSKSLNYGALGRTPRPSSSEKEYITGVRDIGMSKWGRAVEHLTEAVAIATREAGASDGDLELCALSKGALGYAKAATGDLAAALELYKETLPIWQGIHGATAGQLTCVHADIATLTEALGRSSEAYSYLEAFQKTLIEAKGPDDIDVLGISLSLASNLSRRQLSEQAEDIFVATIEKLRQLKRPELQQALSMYYEHLHAYQKNDKAKEVKAEILKMIQASKRK